MYIAWVVYPCWLFSVCIIPRDGWRSRDDTKPKKDAGKDTTLHITLSKCRCVVHVSVRKTFLCAHASTGTILHQAGCIFVFYAIVHIVLLQRSSWAEIRTL